MPQNRGYKAYTGSVTGLFPHSSSYLPAIVDGVFKMRFFPPLTFCSGYWQCTDTVKRNYLTQPSITATVLERNLTTLLLWKASGEADSHKHIWKLNPNFSFMRPLLCFSSLWDFASSSLFLLMFAPGSTCVCKLIKPLAGERVPKVVVTLSWSVPVCPS